MADYQLTATDVVIRTADKAHIPNAAGNIDRQQYERWLADGGVPDPAPPKISPALDRRWYDTAAQILGAT
ncbi:hypothetical protein I6F35_02665 [Bradyrhizobium sp. BRP22]|uniref:hypothetical protein n=1 Tax=Bradyrhizobium sp. BRP22 TaxID=2793821 RepID=UPI001CD66A87|nr:hypothetical protein [Bradyrhizobium sp. BRP22]MCA1452116.1 hypothetical protein [Bradyrhizobium sp. BRP22]